MKRSRFTICADAGRGGQLWYHTLTQAFARVDCAVDGALGAEQLRALQEAGFFVADDANEAERLQARYKRDIQTGETFCLMIAPTLDCNFACPYCYEREVKRKGAMSLETQRQLVDFICQRMDELGSAKASIGWYGGEPLLGLAAMEGITGMLRERQVSFEASMLSNCSLVTEEVAERVLALGISQVLTTIDGVGERHDRHRPSLSGAGSYDSIVRAVALLTERGIQVNVLFNEDRGNAFDLENVKAVFAENPLVQVTGGQIFDYCHLLDKVPDFTRADYDLYESPSELAEKQYAGFLATNPREADFAAFMAPIRLFCGRQVESYCVVDEQGNLYECDGDIGYAERIEGHVSDECAPRHKEYDPFADPLCEECAFLPICLGNCRWTRECIGESCIPQKTIYQQILRDWAETIPQGLAAALGVTMLCQPAEPDWESPVSYSLWS